MLKKLIPVFMGLTGLGVGIGAGIVLRPDPAPALQAAPDAAHHADTAVPAHEASHGKADDGHGGGHGGGHGDKAGATAFVELDRQFVVPVISDGRVASMIVMTINLEVAAEAEETANDKQPKLRDRFLRVLLDQANSGGFDGTFTANGAMERVVTSLTEVGREILGPALHEVLVLDVAKQEL